MTAEPKALRDVVRDHIIAVVAHCGGERLAAARILGLSKHTVSRKLADYAAAGFAVPAPRRARVPSQTAPVPRALRDVVRDHIIAVVEYCGGERRAAARILKISSWTVWNKLTVYAAAGFDIPAAVPGDPADRRRARRRAGESPRAINDAPLSGRVGNRPPIPLAHAAAAAE